MARNVIVGPVVAGRGPAGWMVEADVQHRPIWFTCREVELDPSPEGLAGVVLLAAVERGCRVCITDAVSAAWRTNVALMMETWHAWWGTPVLPPQVQELPAPRPRSPGTTLCFSGGLDSFYSLLCGDVHPDALAFVHGYDISLDDAPRMSSWESHLREIAAAMNLRVYIIRSSLRRHHLLRRCAWDRLHGGAMAAVGHLLAPSAGTLVIASSFPAHYGYRWGSHPQLDPLWSSDRLQVVHHGATHSRFGKLQAIADEELVQRHLRVCWENRSATGNCSRCDKCLCTMVAVVACGSPERFRTFDWPSSLADRIHELPATRYVRTYQELLQADLAGPLHDAIRALLQRSTQQPPRQPPARRWAWLHWIGLRGGDRSN